MMNGTSNTNPTENNKITNILYVMISTNSTKKNKFFSKKLKIFKTKTSPSKNKLKSYKTK